MKLERPVWPLQNRQQNVAEYADIISVLYTSVHFLLYQFISLLFHRFFKPMLNVQYPSHFFRQIQAVILKGISARGSS